MERLNLRIQPGKMYACPVCGRIFHTLHMHGDVDFLNNCECMTAFMDGFIQINKTAIKFSELVNEQPEIMWWLSPVQREDNIHKGYYIGKQ